MTQIHPEHSPDESVHAAEHANVNNVRINLGGTTLLVVVVLVAIIGACGLVMGLNLAKQSQMDQEFKDMKTQDWLKERRLMDYEGLQILNGQKLPSDTEFGPTGNMQMMKPKQPTSQPEKYDGNSRQR